MNISIAFSLSRIADTLLAEAALRHYLNDNAPGLLTRDQLPALKRVLLGELAAIAVETGASMNSDDDELVTLQFEAGTGASPPALRGLIERVVACAAGASIYRGVDAGVAVSYYNHYRSALDSLAVCRACMSVIRPCF